MPKIGVLARNVLYENLCRTEVLYMSRLLKDRLQQHSTPGVLLYDFLSNASVCCLEHNKEWSDSTRKLRESYWIRRLNTLCPFGINKGDWSYSRTPGVLCCCRRSFRSLDMYKTSVLHKFSYKTFLARTPIFGTVLPKSQFCTLYLIH